ncbi:hypothetical protein CANARDRAFT_30011 [[Candida] arabinofermentans NRRL YB-2248]|uniref:Uncharacterized protein n=1 Tax=[Candida] arabinofermentans NRRL YB-2248 TaxID=983967 RepID=A0A1E4SV58_9ASCO|nr:hypothetical protein CANARDRAFT_30011 [[Candida] arabinofermentans NRRL YB-2248]
MFSYKQPELKTPDKFTQNAREVVKNNLTANITSRHTIPQPGQYDAFIQSSRIPQSMLDTNSNIFERVKTGSSILSKFGKRSNSGDSKQVLQQHQQKQPEVPQLPQLPPLLSSQTSYAPSITSTVSSSAASLFSSNSAANSISTDSSSIFGKPFLNNTDYNFNSQIDQLVNSQQQSMGTLTLKLSEVLDVINSSTNIASNAGTQIFNELTYILRNSSNGLNNLDSPEKLIDWNLNLMRVLLFIYKSNEPAEWSNKEVYVKVDDTNAKCVLESEITKIKKMENPKFRRFLSHVMNKQQHNVTAQNEPISLKVEKLNCNNISDTEFSKILVNSELFKEFQIDDDFKNLVATISITNAKKLNSDVYIMLAIRNYFLNLLVAAQTLFEFHYSELIGVNVKNLNPEEKKLLWESIRERNFKKIIVFGCF